MGHSELKVAHTSIYSVLLSCIGKGCDPSLGTWRWHLSLQTDWSASDSRQHQVSWRSRLV